MEKPTDGTEPILAEDPWPRIRADVDRARVLARNVQGADAGPLDRLSSRTDVIESAQQALDRDVRWQEVRILALETELAAARAETGSLVKHLELCFDAISAQDERLSSQQATTTHELSALRERSNRQDREVLDLRSAQNRSSERIEMLSAEILELIHSTSERLEREIREAELAAHDANERLETNVRDSGEEIRVMAEKAKDLAAFSSDSVAGLQADLEEQHEAIRGKLETVATKDELDEIEQQIHAEIMRSVERIEAAQQQLRESQQQSNSDDGEDRATLSQLDASTAALRRDVARELDSLRRLVDGPESETESVAPKQRFRYYLHETHAPTAQNRELPVAIESVATVDED